MQRSVQNTHSAERQELRAREVASTDSRAPKDARADSAQLPADITAAIRCADGCMAAETRLQPRARAARGLRQGAGKAGAEKG